MSYTNNKERNVFGVISGITVTLVSTGAAIAALEFDDESRMFPLVIAILLAAIGVAITFHSYISQGDADRITRGMRGVLPATAIVSLWAIAFGGGAGFILPTFLMQTALLWLTGLRNLFAVAAIAALVTGLAYTLFVVVLDTPLPSSLMPGALQGF